MSMAPNRTGTLLRDIIDIPERVHPGDLVVSLAEGFDTSDAAVADYVVTDQIAARLDEALALVSTAVRANKSHAAYLHGSFGSGKSHFMTVLHTMLTGDPAARAKPALQPLLGKHAGWLKGRRFLLVPYHLIGAESLDAAVLGGYVKRVRQLHPEASTPAVYRDDAMLDDARSWRVRLGDERFIAALGEKADDPDDWDGPSWSPSELDAAFAAPPGDPLRRRLVSDLLDTLLSSYRTSVHGDREAFLPLETGLSVISEHARGLGYDAVVLFLDELILWLSSHLADLAFVSTEANKLVKLIESAEAHRPVPIVSFIARQRNIGELVGRDIAGSEVTSLEDIIKYLERSFDTIALADNNLPAIAGERVLKPRDPAGAKVLDEAFAQVPRDRREVWDTLLDAQGVTHASAEDFRRLYPFSPALMNTLIAISGALQRERTGLKVLQEMLIARRDDLRIGQLVPLGDLWDVLSAGAIQPFSNQLRHEFDAAKGFYQRVRTALLNRYGLTEADVVALPQQHQYRVDDRLVKTLLLAVLAPNVPALRQLTAGRLAALNHGSIRTRIQGQERSQVNDRLKDLAAQFGEIRYTDAEDRVFSLHLTGIDVEAIIDGAPAVPDGARRVLVRDLLWDELGVVDRDSFTPRVEVVWRGTKRIVGLVFGNIRDPRSLADDQFDVEPPEQARVIIDYPFDGGTRSPQEDYNRVTELQRRGKDGPVLCWLPSFLSEQRRAEIGRLLRIRFLLEVPGRLEEHAPNLSSDDLAKARNQLAAQRDNLTSQLREVLAQVYGIARANPDNVGIAWDRPVVCLDDDHQPKLYAGVRFRDALLQLTDGLFTHLYPKHPDFDPDRARVAVRPADLKIVLEEAARAAESGPGGRTEVERGPRRALLRRIAHPLRIGEMVSEAHFVLGDEWRQRINQWLAREQAGRDPSVRELWEWLGRETELRGSDRMIRNLVIAGYALRDDRAWVRHGVEIDPPALDQIDADDVLRARELPSPAEFERALLHAQHLFAARTVKVYSARNVKRLADEVRGWAQRSESAAAALVRLLGEHGHGLGLTPEPARLVTARAASDLVSRLARASEATPLVRLLSGTDVGADGGHRLGSCVAQAAEAVAALESMDWGLATTLRELAGRDDSIGEQARRVRDALAADAASDSPDRRLSPLLERARVATVRLLTEASRLTGSRPGQTPAGGTGVSGRVGITGTGTVGGVWSTGETGAPGGFGTIGGSGAAGTAGGAGLRPDGAGSTVADPPSGGTDGGPATPGKVRATGRDLEPALAELRELARRRPEAEFEITWNVVGEP